MSQRVASPVGFSDSELIGYTKVESTVTVDVRAWNGQHLRVTLANVIALRELLAGSFSDFVCNPSESGDLLREALARNYEKVPVAHPYSVYSFFNVDDQPALEVVAGSCRIEATQA